MNPATLEAPEPVEELEAPKPTATLTVHDRCDACGSQAYVSVLFETGDLLFCAHHGKSYLTKIGDKAVKIVDESWRLDTGRLDVSA